MVEDGLNKINSSSVWGMSKNDSKHTSFPYHIFTPILIGLFLLYYFFPSIFKQFISPLFLLVIGQITFGQYLLSLVSLVQIVVVNAVVLSFIVITLLGWVGVHYYYYYRAKKEMRVIRVIPNENIESTTKKVDDFVRDIHKRNRVRFQRFLRGREWFGYLLYVNEEHEIEIYFTFPQDKYKGITRTFLDHFPGSEWFEVDPKEIPIMKSTENLYGGFFRLNQRGRRAGLPLQPYEKSELGSILTHMSPNTWLFIRLSPNVTSKNLEKRSNRGLKNLGMTREELADMINIDLELPNRSMSTLSPQEKARYQALYKMNTGREKEFIVSIDLWGDHRHASGTVQDTKSSIERIMEFDNYIRMHIVYLFKRWRNPFRSIRPIPSFWKRMYWSHMELANLLHLPDKEDKIYEIPSKKGSRPYLPAFQKGQAPIPKREFNQGILIGTHDHPIVKDRAVRIPDHIWTYMSFGVGETGYGKTSFLLNLLYDHLHERWYHDADAPGFTFVESKGEDGCLKLLAKIRADLKRLEADGVNTDQLKQRIHYFDLSSNQHILGLNLLHKTYGIKNEEIVNYTLDLLKGTYQSDSQILLDKYGQIALHTLLLDDRDHTILGVEQILRDETFRNRILPIVKGNPLLEGYWKEFRKQSNEKDVLPIINRMQKIRLNSRMRRLFGQKNMNLRPLEWMDNGHIVIINTSGLSEEERRIAMGFIITQYHYQARRRKRKSKIHLHILDEFHLVQLPVVKRILAMDRYTGHCLVPFTQDTEQIQSDILNTFDGNASTLFCFNQGSKSAQRIQQMSRGHIDADDVQNLAKLQAIVSTIDQDGNRITFRIKTNPPYLFGEDGKPTYYGRDINRRDREEKKAYELARQFGESLMSRDCDPVEEVDQWIEDYLRQKTIQQIDQEQSFNESMGRREDKGGVVDQQSSLNELQQEKLGSETTKDTEEAEQLNSDEGEDEYFTPEY